MLRNLIASFALLLLLGLWTLGGPAAGPSSASAAPAAIGQDYGLHSLSGAHGFSYSGSAAGLGEVASSGRIDFDGAGGLSAVFTTSVGGTAFTGSFVGTYRVNADGTGSIVIHLPWLGTRAHGDFVIVEHGAGTFFTATDRGYSVTGRTSRM